MKKKVEVFTPNNEDSIINYLKSVEMKRDDLKMIEKRIKLTLFNEYKEIYKEYLNMVNNLNLVAETVKFSRNFTGIINLLEAIYKFEAIFHSDVTTLVIKIPTNVYYANINVYVPLSEKTFSTIKSELDALIKKIRAREKVKVLDFSPSQLDRENFVKNDKIAGKLFIPLYISGKKFGNLIFYYIDYRGARKEL